MSNSEHSPNSETNSCVLVVDDNDQVRQMLAMALETAGFDVVVAGTQLELQRRLVDTRPHALVLDLQRSETDGLVLLERMRARQSLRDVPIIFLAGSDDDEFRWQAMRAGADWFGLRPLGMIELQNEVGRLIRQGRPTARHPRHQRVSKPAARLRSLKRVG
jgi:DNA-binding response OmpR family regulator